MRPPHYFPLFLTLRALILLSLVIVCLERLPIEVTSTSVLLVLEGVGLEGFLTSTNGITPTPGGDSNLNLGHDSFHVSTRISRSLKNVGDLKRDTPPLPERHKPAKVRSLRRRANLAWKAGRKLWRELRSFSNVSHIVANPVDETVAVCPKSLFLVGDAVQDAHGLLKFPCGLTLGSSITVVGIPQPPRIEYKSSIGHIGDLETEVSQFMLELHGPNDSKGQEPSRILHINPRLKGDWSDRPIIELNSFLKGQWGRSQRCDGSKSQYHDTVEGFPRCEEWSKHDKNESSWWLGRLVGAGKAELHWPYPFQQNHSFIMTVRAGLEGYHMSVDGKHVASYPYSAGLLDENIAACYIGGDVDLQAVIATALPSLSPKTMNEQVFEDWQRWKAPKLSGNSVDLFIGVTSASNNFAERMAVRSTWFQAKEIQSANVIARFFVAMHQEAGINLRIIKESNYYGDMVILPYMDEYDLVVLKTLAICEYGVRNVSTKYIMKSDDDSFIRVDAVLNELKTIKEAESVYMGNLNMFHKPFRTGKWAVTFEEWPDEEYPTYANSPGYIVSRKVANFITMRNKKRLLELFKMEDVSMGLWVKLYNDSIEPVEYVNIWKFFQAGCEEGYILAHYQSPVQMLCMWKNLLKGEVQCCN